MRVTANPPIYCGTPWPHDPAVKCNELLWHHDAHVKWVDGRAICIWDDRVLDDLKALGAAK